MVQRWHDLLFAHWPADAETVSSQLPPGLTLDRFEGEVWVGVVPFRMSGVWPRFLPSLPWLSAFPELNVRTYVTAQGRPGVYFFSLDAGNPAAVAIARSLYHLPYFRAAMHCLHRGDEIGYSSVRTHRGAPKARFEGRYGPTGAPYHAATGSLEHWLTERYALYTSDRGGRIYRGDIQHAPWPLQPANADIRTNTMAAAAGLDLADTQPLLHFARRLDVLAWSLTRL